MSTDVEYLLREGMERFTRDLRAPAGLTYRVARRRRRRMLLRSVTAVAAALTAGAVALVAVMVTGARDDGAGGPVVTTAYVVQRVDGALHTAEPGAIAQMTVTTRGAVMPGGANATTTTEEWSYGRQWRSVTKSAAGQTVYDEGSSAASVYTVVSYLTRTWARERGLSRPQAQFSTARRCGPVLGLPLLFRFGLPGIGLAGGSLFANSLPATVARDLHAAISCGTLVVAGRQRVDGIEAIELTSRPVSPVSETIWVSPGTYLPVRVIVRSAFGAPAPRQQTANITWLPPTATNLARLTVPIPAGFRRVPLVLAVLPILQRLPGIPVPKPNLFCLTPGRLACKAGPGGGFGGGPGGGGPGGLSNSFSKINAAKDPG